MAEPAARTESFDRASAAASYIWEVPQKPVRIRVALDLIDRLGHDVVESFRSLNSPGSEIGGLLLGSVEGGTPREVLIEQYELMPCSYSRGPLYRLAAPDVEYLQRGLAKHPPSRVVGFFRSHTRKLFSLESEDLEVIGKYFSQPHQVALLIRPYATKASTAGFFIWEQGAMRAEPYLEFPFRRLELERGAGGARQAQAPVAPAVQPVPPLSRAPGRAAIVPIASRREIALPPPPEVIEEKAAPEPAPEPARPAPVVKSPEPPPPAPVPLAKEVRVAKEPASVEPPPASALPEQEPAVPFLKSKAAWIAGGAAAAILLLGGVLLLPKSHTRQSQPVPTQANVAVVAPASQAPVPMTTVQRVVVSAPEPREALPPKPDVARPSPKAFRPESLARVARPERPSDLPEAPGLTASSAQSPMLPLNLSTPAPAMPAPSAPPQVQQPQTAPPPIPAPRPGGQVEEARLLTHVNPDYPPAAKQAHVEGKVVVSAVIGTDGRIRSAKAISGSPLLSGAAVMAVKHWTYRPAILNGAPIDSETRVEVMFELQH